MADLPDLPDWLAQKITDFLRRVGSGQVILNVNQHRVESFDLNEHGRVRAPESCMKRPS